MHAAVTIANIAYNNESAQVYLGNISAVEHLLKLCTSKIADVLEACTAALANLVCFNDANCQRVVAASGVPNLLNIVHSDAAESLLDLDQTQEIHANVIETMANVCRYCPVGIGHEFSEAVLGDIVLLCASSNLQVRTMQSITRATY